MPGFLGSEVTVPSVYVSGAVSEEAREPAYRAEVLKLFQQRLKLVSTLAMVALPAFALFYWILLPEMGAQLNLVYAILWTYCALMRSTAHRMKTLEAGRIFTIISYAVFSVAASDILNLASKQGSLLFGTHNHIMLSVLLLPLAMWECALIGLIVNAALGFVVLTHYNSPQAYLYASHMVVLMTTTLFILCIAHWQGLLRRRAFDAAFDVMRSAEKLKALSFLDPLTGGFNRRYLDKTLKIEIARAIRFARPLSVMMFDLDNFKKVNDERGHSAGDDVLREIWQAAENTVREVDTLARYGGDEFTIVLPETDETSAHAIAERLQECAQARLLNRFGADTLEGSVTLSIGISTVRLTEPVLPDKILDSADERLYEAKRFGKNHIAN